MITMTKYARLTGDDREQFTAQLKADYERGASLRDLADQTGGSYALVRRLLLEHGVVLRSRGGQVKS